MFRSIQTLCERHIYWTFPLFWCVHGWTFFLLFLSAHFTNRELQHFSFVCALILGYYVHIFCITDARYVMFRVCWHKSLKGSVNPEHLSVYQTTRSSTSLPHNQEHLPVYQRARGTYQFTKEPGAPTSLPKSQGHLPVYQRARGTYQFTKEPGALTSLARSQGHLPVYQRARGTYQFTKEPGALTSLHGEDEGAHKRRKALAWLGQESGGAEDEGGDSLVSSVEHKVLIHQVTDHQGQQFARPLGEHTVAARGKKTDGFTNKILHISVNTRLLQGAKREVISPTKSFKSLWKY